MTDRAPLIIVNLNGGLGNQMFQYACGYAQAHDRGCALRIAMDMFDARAAHNGPELSRVFPISAGIASMGQMREVLGGWRTPPKVRRWLGHRALKRLRGPGFVAEAQYRFDDALQKTRECSLYLQGYWQSERYFACYADALREEFSFKETLDERNTALAREIRRGISLSIHVRRGDYAQSSIARAYHGLCPPEYYIDAIETARGRVPDVRIFAFSDDPAWVRENLGARYPEMAVVDHNSGDQSYNDMRLMSLCHHHIIANSSFSWWGAWLNPDPDKLVIAPRRWFANGPDTRDLIPDNWLQL